MSLLQSWDCFKIFFRPVWIFDIFHVVMLFFPERQMMRLHG